MSRKNSIRRLTASELAAVMEMPSESPSMIAVP